MTYCNLNHDIKHFFHLFDKKNKLSSMLKDKQDNPYYQNRISLISAMASIKIT